MKRSGHANQILFVPLALAALFLGACKDELGPGATQRWIYLPVSTVFNSPPADAGLFRYSLVNRTTERAAPLSASIVSAVGRNGNVAFGYDSLRQHWWGRVGDNLVPLPLPAAEDADFGYECLWPGSIAMCLDGSRAAYALVRSPVAPGFPERVTHRILLYDCTSGQSQILDFQDFALRQMAAAGATLARTNGNLYFTTEKGDELLFEAVGFSFDGGILKEKGRVIIRWSNGAFSAAMPADTSAPNSDGYTTLAAYAPGARTMILRRRTGGAQKFFARALGSQVETPLPYASNTALTRHQFSHAADELVVWGVNGIEIRRASDGSVLSYPILYGDVDRLFGPQQYGQIRNLSMSPDGEWILFGAIPAGQPNRTGVDLYAARRDGSDIRLVAADLHTYEAAISVTVAR